MALSRVEKMVIEQFQLDPTDNARAHRVAKLLEEGKLGTVNRNADHDYVWFDLWSKQKKEYDTLLAKLTEERKERRERMVFRNDPRKLIFEASVWQSFVERTCDHDDDGSRISWTNRQYAIEQFRIDLYKWKTVTFDTLREITLALHRARNRPPVFPAMDRYVTRAGPPTQDWKKVRDRVQKAA